MKEINNQNENSSVEKSTSYKPPLFTKDFFDTLIKYDSKKNESKEISDSPNDETEEDHPTKVMKLI